MSTPDTNSFNDITNQEFDDLLYEVTSGKELLAIGDINAIAREHYNNAILELWADSNQRCRDCGARLDEELDCPACDCDKGEWLGI